jgi:thiol-disulfide isomerase/thioredoxin
MSETASPAEPRSLSRSSSIAPIAILAAIGVVVLVGIGLDQAGVWGGPKKRMAPDVTFYDRGGKPVSLSDYRGKVVLLNFWATWCGPCVEEAPSLDALSRHLASALPEVVILAPALDDEGFKAIDPFVEKLKLGSLAVVHDKKKEAFKFGTRKLPETWLLSRDGEILERFVGSIDYSSPEMFALLEKVAKQGPDSLKKKETASADR